MFLYHIHKCGEIAMYKGILFVIAAASGTGKTTLAKALIKQDLNLKASISYTTRPKRDDEVEGKSYHFVDDEKFDALLAEGLFLEHAAVYNYRYATPKAYVESILNKGIDALLVLDWQGVQALKKAYQDVVSIFLLPPSVKALQDRLTQRSSHSGEKEGRQETFYEDLHHCEGCDYLVINDQFTKAVQELMAIIDAERLKTGRQSLKNTGLIKSLLAEVEKNS